MRAPVLVSSPTRSPTPGTTFLLGVCGVSIDAAVNVGDIFRRFLDNAPDENGLPTRAVFRKSLQDSLASLVDDSYDQITIVGHSFGAVVALDAIAEGLERRVRFVTLGGFLSFLSTRSPWLPDRIKECCESANLVSWNDYYSEDDPFAGAAPFPAHKGDLHTQVVDNRANFYDSLTGKSHKMYYQNSFVRDAIFDCPRPPRVRA
jgi:pimeloyl-ACP methyl ester carboxylesterase